MNSTISNPQFNHDKLTVYREALHFQEWLHPILISLSGQKVIKDQIERASISIALNIAEGNGKFTPKDRCRFFDISRGSTLECAACLDILFKKGQISNETRMEGKHLLHTIVRMQVGLIKSTSTTREY